ncbi:MAG: opgE [Firmicutes bacterium]|nr:opgE [Bacillota bacterium]
MGILIIIISVLIISVKDTLAVKAVNRISRLHGDQLIQNFYPISSKFWLHRSDSLEKTAEFSDKYNGIELDIIFFNKESDFDVSHDSNGRIDYPLESFLQFLTGTENKIWLDFKNLNINNAVQSSNLLEEMLSRNHIDKNRVIVESHDYNALGYFKNKGFYTSFYCPVDDKYLNTEEGKTLFTSLVLKAVDSGNVNAVSFPVGYYSLVKSTNIKVDFLTWNENEKWFKFYFNPELQKVLNDQQVKVILVKDSAKVNR